MQCEKHRCLLMSILQYLKPISKPTTTPDGLSCPMGSLSAVIAPAAIESANSLVREVQQQKKTVARGPYHKLSPALRANIGKYACENGVCAAARHFSHRLEKSLNESTVRSIKKAYLIEVGQKRRFDETVSVLPPQKRGRPLLLGDKLDDQVQRYLKKVRECGGTVNTAITIAGAKGLLLKQDRTRLQEYGGPITLSKAWAKSLLLRMGFVKRRGTTKSRVTVDNFDRIKKDFLAEITSTVEMEEIPPGTYFQLGSNGHPFSTSIILDNGSQGANRVEIAGLTDKRQITAVFCGNMNGEFLPIQLIYAGKPGVS